MCGLRRAPEELTVTGPTLALGDPDLHDTVVDRTIYETILSK